MYSEEHNIAAHSILEDISTHTVKLDLDGINQALAIVIGAIRKSLHDNNLQALRKTVRELDDILNPRDKKEYS